MSKTHWSIVKSKSKRLHFFARGILILLGFITLTIVAGVVYQALATTNDLKRFPPPGQLVEVDGLKYHLNCLGTGSPTVILEAGLGESSLSWYPVQSKISKFIRVCAYDRAGLGWSQGASQLISVDQVAKTLHQLLQNAAIPAPYILVGHSRGGIYVRNFFHQFSSEVKGMVLVDSTHENSGFRSLPYAESAYAKQKTQMTFALPLAAIGFIRLAGWTNADRQASPLPTDILAAKTAVQNRTDTARAFVNEVNVMRQSLDPNFPAPTSLGDLPLVVLTSGQGIDLELAKEKAKSRNQSIENEIAIAKLELVLQNELAALSTKSQHMIAKKSGHYIMYDQPDLVIQAVLDLVKKTRD
jgi:pimeloyl-ACP methyl ester carboxylesterase